MSNSRFSRNLSTLVPVRKRLIVTTKQYIAIADDFLRKLFPEITPDRLPYPGHITVFVIDDYSVLH